MPHLNNIVSFINDHLKENALKSRKFQGGQFYGLAKKVTIVDDENHAKPAVMTSDGYGIEVTPDETYPISIYHRCLGGSFADALGWGDGLGISELNNMLMVVYADPAKVEITQEDLAFIIAAGLPDKKFSISDENTAKRASAKVTPLSFENDSKKVFTGEYEAGVLPQPQAIYFSLSYRIETTADRECVMCP